MDPTDPISQFYSAQYGSTPPPNSRRPHLQFPPPPPYPPPTPQRTAFYEDPAGNIVLLEEFGAATNLAMCLEDETSDRNNFEPFASKLSDKVLFNDRSKRQKKANNVTRQLLTEADAYSYAYYEPGPSNAAAIELQMMQEQEIQRRMEHEVRLGFSSVEMRRQSPGVRITNPINANVEFPCGRLPTNFVEQHECRGTNVTEQRECRAANLGDSRECRGGNLMEQRECRAAHLVDSRECREQRDCRGGNMNDHPVPREARHTYTTRYGTEENIYEEIGEVAALAKRMDEEDELNQSELYATEVLRVESRHRRVLDELNLTVEAMLMPERSLNGDESCGRSTSRPDLLEDLLRVGPTDDLLSPPPDASYQCFKRPQLPRGAASAGSGYQRLAKPDPAGPKPGFWAKKRWKCLPKLSSTVRDETRCVGGVAAWDEPANEEAALRRVDQSQRSVDESWYSGSEREASISSGDESCDRNSIRSNGQLKTTLYKARHLCDKLRVSTPMIPPINSTEPTGRLSRWFSIRRGSSYDIEQAGDLSNTVGVAGMPLLVEAEEGLYPRPRQPPPALPSPPPAQLTPLQLKRRHIVAAIVHSENSYLQTLQRLVNDYKKPLEDSSPPILGSIKIATLFHRLPEILQCHTLFRIALAESVLHWDQQERLGDVFVASFSKAVVLDVYSGFINNFSAAMDLAKTEAKRKSALAEFFKVKQVSAHDRLSFFGLMVKPVQRFPQFILFLQDLLKHTPHGHADRMSLQLALTQLESLAEMLNERKREAEQFQAFKQTLRHLSSKFTVRPLSDANRCLLREDDVVMMEVNAQGHIGKVKRRRLLLLNDLVVCVSVSPKQTETFRSSDRLSLKWTVPVTDIEVLDSCSSPTLSRLLSAGQSRAPASKLDQSAVSIGGSAADDLCVEMSRLMHDYQQISHVADLLASLHGTYKELSVDAARTLLASIQHSIQHAGERMAWVDACCIQVSVRGTKTSHSFQTDSPRVKQEWLTELRLAQLALDPNNAPAWEVPEQERRPATKMPLFVSAVPLCPAEVSCGCYYLTAAKGRQQPGNHLWLATSDQTVSRICVYTHTRQGRLREVAAGQEMVAEVTAMEHAGDCVYIGTRDGSVTLRDAVDLNNSDAIATLTSTSSVTRIVTHRGAVFVAHSDGSLDRYVIGRQPGEPVRLQLGDEPITCLLAINQELYAAIGKRLMVVDMNTNTVSRSVTVQHPTSILLLAASGVGLWLASTDSSTVCLYHTETFKHLQDINVATNVLRLASLHCCSVHVTALLACKGLLWVGTNVGVALTIPLPRLEGVPIISGRVNVSYHGHLGPITFLLPLQASNPPYIAPSPTEPSHHDSPVVLRRRKSKEVCRTARTLPRSLGSAVSQISAECDVYGLYGELMNVRDYDVRRSDPDMHAPRPRIRRPRSLDLSNWSVSSRASSANSSSSEDVRIQEAGGRPLGRRSSDGELSEVKPAPATKAESNKATERRTVITLMGGRGYVNWRQCCPVDTTKKNATDPLNMSDAHIVIWETKL